jgi:maleylpyruvate isomerase
MNTDDPTIVLHGYYRSSTSYRTRIALNLKGLDYGQRAVPLTDNAQFSDAFLRLNPLGSVPALEIDGDVLIQSPAIIDYLEERFPAPPLLPREPAARQRVREVCNAIACDIHPLNNLRVLRHLRQRLGQDDAGIREWYRHWIHTGFDGVEKLLARSSSTGRFCVGDAVTQADAYLIPQAYNATRFDVDLSAYPLIAGIVAHCAALPAFADAHPDRQPDAPDGD